MIGTGIALLVSAVLLISVTVYSALLMSSALSELGEATANFTSGRSAVGVDDAVALPKINAVLISAPDCADCADHAQLVSALNRSSELAYSELGYGSDEAAAAISEYKINALPAVIISGEVDKLQAIASLVSSARKVDGAHVMEAQSLPYYSVQDARVFGRVNATVITVQDCADCLPALMIIDQLRSAGVVISGVTQHEYGSAGASELIAEYGLEKLPALVLSEDLARYKALLGEDGFEDIFVEQADGSFLFGFYNFPYLEPETGRIRGYVEMVLIDDESCAPCYDPMTHTNAVGTYGVIVNSTISYDINSTEGAELVAKYNITKIPTMILSPEAAIYPVLMGVWPDVGTVEPDGWHVFREIELTGGSYKNLETGIIVLVEEG